jgi:hypothetical protein
MSVTLQQRYERLVRVYPADIRAEQGAAMLDTLLEVAGPDRRRPAAREAWSLILGGLRGRFGAHARLTPAAIWLSATRMGVLLLLAYATSTALGWLLMTVVDGHGLWSSISRPQLWVAVAAVYGLAFVSVARNRYLAGAAWTVLGAVAAHFADPFSDDYAAPTYLGDVLPGLIAALLLVSLVWWRPVERPVVGRWLLAIPAAFLLMPGWLSNMAFDHLRVQTQPWGWTAVVIGGLALSAIDLRAPIAVGLLLAPLLAADIAAVLHYEFNPHESSILVVFDADEGSLAVVAALLAPVLVLLATGALGARRRLRV